jgi:integrin beta 3
MDGRDGAAGLPGERGEKGMDGRDGATGLPGERGPSGEAGPDGAPGRDGRDGAPGVDGQRGERGQIGKDGIDGKDGRDGTDGRDGFQLEDFDVELKDGRDIVVTLRAAGRLLTKTVSLPVPIDRGVHRSGAKHRQGDGVTYGGSFWIAQKDTTAAPGGDSADWRLAVKRGKDGKDNT